MDKENMMTTNVLGGTALAAPLLMSNGGIDRDVYETLKQPEARETMRDVSFYQKLYQERISEPHEEFLNIDALTDILE